MRSIPILFFVLTAFICNDQSTLVSGKTVFESKWLKNEISENLWFGYKDTVKMEIGKVVTEIKKDGQHIMVVTEVKMKNRPAQWIDSTIADIYTLAPVHHSSYNMQRDRVLNF